MFSLSQASVKREAPNLNSQYDPTHQYADILVCNNSEDLQPLPVIFNQQKTSNICDDTSEYYMSVIRWSMDASIPQIIPDIELAAIPDQANTLATKYVVNMCFLDEAAGSPVPVFPTNSDKTVIFAPDDLTTSAPVYTPTNINQVFLNPFYQLHSVQAFLNMVNKSLLESFNVLKAAATANGWPSLNSDIAPQLQWDPATQKIALYVSSNFVFLPGVQNRKYKITMNVPLYNLFNTFPAVCWGFYPGTSATRPLGSNYEFKLVGQYETIISIPNGTTEITLTKYTQETSSVPGWCPASSIVFVSYSIPVNPVLSGAPQFYGEALLSGLNQSASSNVITDFEIPMVAGTEYSGGIVYYLPQSEYRLIDLLGSQALSNLNIRVQWRSKFGYYYDFVLKNGGSATLKLLLRKKDFNA